MGVFDVNRHVLIDNAISHEIEHVTFNSVTNQVELRIFNERFQKDWNAFMGIPKARSAIIMKGIWTCGKGIIAKPQIMNQLKLWKGNGKQTVRDILFSLVVTKQVARDAYALKVVDEDMKSVWNPQGIINLIQLDSKDAVQVYNDKGQITSYEFRVPTGQDAKKGITYGYKSYSPDEIFHLTHHRFAGETQGRSVLEGMEKIILADDESREICRRTAKFQAVPFIVFKVKSDDPTTLNNLKASIKAAREEGQDMLVPDDENILSFQTVTITPSNFLLEWRRMNDEEFYRAAGMPMVIFGGGGTEANGKTAYLGHETVFDHDGRYLEEQFLAQLGMEIKLNRPVSLLQDMQLDEVKDNQNALTFQPNDVTAGVGRDNE